MYHEVDLDEDIKRFGKILINYEFESNIKNNKYLTSDAKDKILQKMNKLNDLSERALDNAKMNAKAQGRAIIKEDLEDAINVAFEGYLSSISLEDINEAVIEGANWLKTSCESGSTWDVAMKILSLRKIGLDSKSEVIKKCAECLIDPKKRNSEGLWRSPLEKDPNISNIIDTSFAIVALIEAGANPESEIIQKAVKFIKEELHPYGGWPSKRGESLDVAATSWAMMALLKAGVDSDSDFIRRPVDWLKYNQREDGGWGGLCKRDSEESLVTKTYDAITALLAAGEGPTSQPIKKAINMLIKLQELVPDKGGRLWGWGWEKPSGLFIVSGVDNTACAILALLSCGENSNSSAIISGVNWLMERRNENGYWGGHTPRVVMSLYEYVSKSKNFEDQRAKHGQEAQ